jgi:hypothetical protein
MRVVEKGILELMQMYVFTVNNGLDNSELIIEVGGVKKFPS